MNAYLYPIHGSKLQSQSIGRVLVSGSEWYLQEHHLPKVRESNGITSARIFTLLNRGDHIEIRQAHAFANIFFETS